MEFSKKYQLIELLPGQGVQSYRARQTNTGRDVTVHLLVGGKTPENEGFLVRLRAMQPHSMAKLIEVGEYQGATFVVTVAPPYQRLDEWLAEQDRADAAAKEFGKAGFWKRPEVGSLAPPPPAKAPGSRRRLRNPGSLPSSSSGRRRRRQNQVFRLQRRCGQRIRRRLRLRRKVTNLRSCSPLRVRRRVRRRRRLRRGGGIGRERASLRRCFKVGVAPRGGREPVFAGWLPAAAARSGQRPALAAEAGEFTKMFQSPGCAADGGARLAGRSGECTGDAVATCGRRDVGGSGRVYEDVPECGCARRRSQVYRLFRRVHR